MRMMAGARWRLRWVHEAVRGGGGALRVLWAWALLLLSSTSDCASSL
jgi:hypothetical protein